MTITLGLWMVPAIMTLGLFVWGGTHQRTDACDIGGAVTAVVWMIACLVAWLMLGLSWLM